MQYIDEKPSQECPSLRKRYEELFDRMDRTALAIGYKNNGVPYNNDEFVELADNNVDELGGVMKAMLNTKLDN